MIEGIEKHDKKINGCKKGKTPFKGLSKRKRGEFRGVR